MVIVGGNYITQPSMLSLLKLRSGKRREVDSGDLKNLPDIESIGIVGGKTRHRSSLAVGLCWAKSGVCKRGVNWARQGNAAKKC